MEVSKQDKLEFHGVDILNVNFNLLIPREDKLKINIKCTPKVFYPEDQIHAFKIIMEVELRDEQHFELYIRAAGNFEVGAELDSESRSKFINANAPAIMFPYIRFITTLTANLGNVTGPLVIPTQFFKGELEEIK